MVLWSHVSPDRARSAFAFVDPLSWQLHAYLFGKDVLIAQRIRLDADTSLVELLK